MSDARVKGVVHLIEDTKTYGQKGFRKRLVVLEQNNNRFTNYVPLEFTNDGVDTVDELNVGDEVEVVYRLSGRKWQKDATSEVKFFLNAEAISFKVIKGRVETSESHEPEDAGASVAGDEEIPF